MKFAQIILAITVLLVTGCTYEYPLTTEHNIPIDPAVLGLWEWIPDYDDEPVPPEEVNEVKEALEDYRMLILKFSDTEYLIRYPVDGHNDIYYWYFRGYPVKIGNISCVQVEYLGSIDEGPAVEKNERFFVVVKFALENDELEMRGINTDLVNTDLESSEALRKAFLVNQENKDLFKNHIKFRRVED